MARAGAIVDGTAEGHSMPTTEGSSDATHSGTDGNLDSTLGTC